MEEKERVISCCGVVCSACQYFPAACAGCPAIKGKVFWLQYVDAPACPIYQCCVEERGLDHCGLCASLPCERYHRYADPNVSPEEAAAGERAQVALLRGLAGAPPQEAPAP